MDFDDLTLIINDEIDNMKVVSSSINLKLNVKKTKLLLFDVLFNTNFN